MNGWLNPAQRRRADQLISVFENGSTVIDYAFAENLHDGRGLTAGRAGFTTATGDALDVVSSLGTGCLEELRSFLPELRRLALFESDDTTGLPEIDFINAWRAASADQRFRDAQDRIVDREYYEPAMRIADELGIDSPLARAQIYDAAIQHGVGDDSDSLSALIERTIPKGTGSADAEADWLDDFFAVRIAALRAPASPATAAVWRVSVDRVHCMRRLASLGNRNLDGPFEAEVFGSRFTIV